MKGAQQVKNLVKELSGGFKPKNKSTTERLDKLEADIARIIEMLIIIHQTRQNDNEDIKYYVKCVSDLTLNNHEIKNTSRVHEAIAKSIEGKIDGFLESVNLSNKEKSKVLTGTDLDNLPFPVQFLRPLSIDVIKTTKVDFLRTRAQTFFRNNDLIYWGDVACITNDYSYGKRCMDRTLGHGKKTLSFIESIMSALNIAYDDECLYQTVWRPKNIEELSNLYMSSSYCMSFPFLEIR